MRPGKLKSGDPVNRGMNVQLKVVADLAKGKNLDFLIENAKYHYQTKRSKRPCERLLKAMKTYENYKDNKQITEKS